MQEKIVNIQKKTLAANILLLLLIVFLGGCGRVDEAEVDTEYDKPPVSCESVGANPLAKNAHWDILTIPDNEEKTPKEQLDEVYTEQIDELAGVTMTVSSVTAEGATILCTNSTEKEIVFRDDYELQVWKDGEKKAGDWYQVEYTIDNGVFVAVDYTLSQDMSLDWDVNWTYFHGVLPAGHYRITKTALDFREPGDFTKYNLAAEFTVLDEEENRELNEENEKTFYEAAEASGLEKEEAEGYFHMLCQDGVIQNGIAKLRGLVIDDFDQNGQKDIAVMVGANNLVCYGTGRIYFYMDGKKTYRFYEEWFPFGYDFFASSADLDRDGYTEIVFGARGTGCGGSGDWYNRILKYKNHTMEKMEIPTEETQDDITVVITKDEKENTYRAYCDYLDDEIVFETYNPDMASYGGSGSNYRGFYDVQCVAYEDGYAVQASIYLSGCGNANCVGEAKFLIVWEEDGSSHFEKWWIEPHYHKW